MPRTKVCDKRKNASKSKTKSVFMSLKNFLFSCTGKNSVRVQPQHISVQPAAAKPTDGAQPSTPPPVFCSSRPQTGATERPNTCQQPIQVSTKLVVGNTCSNSTKFICGLDATSGHTISTRPEFIGHNMDASKSDLEGLSPSPATSSTSTNNLPRVSDVGERRASGYYCTTLTQLRKMQRQKRMEERAKREQQFGRKVDESSSHKIILVEEEKPKKKLSEQIHDEEVAIKEMQRMLVDLDQDETDVFKKMQELNNWRVKIETIKDNYQYICKTAKLNDVILILEERLHMLKNAGERIEANIGFKKETIAKLRAELEKLTAAGLSEEDLETEELLKQFLPTLGLPPDTVIATNLDEGDEDEDLPGNSRNVPPRCRNPVAVQLMGKKSRRKRGSGKSFMPPMPDILDEYLQTPKQDSALMKRGENDGMMKFMQSQMQNGSGQ